MYYEDIFKFLDISTYDDAVSIPYSDPTKKDSNLTLINMYCEDIFTFFDIPTYDQVVSMLCFDKILTGFEIKFSLRLSMSYCSSYVVC